MTTRHDDLVDNKPTAFSGDIISYLLLPFMACSRKVVRHSNPPPPKLLQFQKAPRQVDLVFSVIWERETSKNLMICSYDRRQWQDGAQPR